MIFEPMDAVIGRTELDFGLISVFQLTFMFSLDAPIHI